MRRTMCRRAIVRQMERIAACRYRAGARRGNPPPGASMPTMAHNPQSLFPQYSAYHHAVEVRGDARLLFISGLNGYLTDGVTMPESFEEQAEIIWGHLRSILASAGMTIANLVSLRFYLADPADDPKNVEV